MTFELERPLVFLDAESTGVNTDDDRIVELTVCRFEPNGPPGPEIKSRLIFPMMLIPPEATAIHGITDADVADEPSFAHVANNLLEILSDVDYGGFNIVGFDLPLLEAEFARCDLEFAWQDASCVDGYAIMAQREPRTLAGALKFYTGRDVDPADLHRSETDVTIAVQVVMSQISRYGDLGATADQLDAAGRRPEWADRQGKIIRNDDGEFAFGFGKHYGKPIGSQVGYLRWMLNDADFPTDTNAIIAAVVAAHEAAKNPQQELP